ncbi:MAG: alkaline phosphatase family protein [Fidelibacterota bacterium]
MKARVIVIGLDGASFDVIGPFIEKGVMPALKGLMERGVYAVMNSTVPPLTCPAWFSFSTGKNPGKFGMYNFFRMEKGSYEIKRFSNADIWTHQELWDVLNQHQLTAGIFNNPVAYPPKRVNGYMVAGFLTPSTRSKFTCPDELKRELDLVSGGYEIDSDQGDRIKDELVVESCFRVLKKRTKCIEHLMSTRPMDFMLMVYTGIDRICHQILNLIYDGGDDRSRWAGEVLSDFLRQVDLELSGVLKLTDRNDIIIVMSDHGFCRRDRGFYINQWLIDRGYLVLKGKQTFLSRAGITQKGIARKVERLGLKNFLRGIAPGFLEQRIPMGVIEGEGNSIIDIIRGDMVDWSRTKAVAIPGGIYLNTVDRPSGIVKFGEDYRKLREDIISGLGEISNPDTGEKLKIRAIDREKEYSGPFVSWAPDIQLEIEERTWGLIRNIPEKRKLFDNLKLAHHNGRAIFIACGPGIKKGKVIAGGGKEGLTSGKFTAEALSSLTPGVNIVDLAPTIVFLYGLPVPVDMDGVVLKRIFERGSDFANREIQYIDSRRMEREDFEYSEEDRKRVEERLRGLGYVD